MYKKRLKWDCIWNYILKTSRMEKGSRAYPHLCCQEFTPQSYGSQPTISMFQSCFRNRPTACCPAHAMPKLTKFSTINLVLRTLNGACSKSFFQEVLRPFQETGNVVHRLLYFAIPSVGRVEGFKRFIENPQGHALPMPTGFPTLVIPSSRIKADADAAIVPQVLGNIL